MNRREFLRNTLIAGVGAACKINAQALVPNLAVQLFNQPAGAPTMKKIDYAYPITNWDVYDFGDCYSSLYMFLEKMSAEKVDYLCMKQEKGDCYGCKHGLCRETGFPPARIHEILNFTFDTLSGKISAIRAYGRQSDISKVINGTDDTIAFMMKYTGYNFEKHTDDIMGKAALSIDADVPVLARLKSEPDRFRIVIGYDDASLIAAQKPDERKLSVDEIANVYLITGKTGRTLTLVDALKRIKHVMDCNAETGLWDEYIENFRFWGVRENAGLEDIKTRFNNLKSLMDTWYCHSFAETFRHKILPELKDERLAKAMKTIDWAYDDSHTAGWAANALYNCRDWTKRISGSTEAGYFTLASDVAKRLKKNDEHVYNVVCEMIGILEN